jgi:Tfp pilus assembly protein PilF
LILSLGLIALTASNAGCRAMARSELTEAERARAEERIDDAIRSLQQAIQIDPEYADAHQQLAMAYKERGELGKAAESMQTAVELEPDHFDWVYELGELYRQLKQFSQAVRGVCLG